MLSSSAVSVATQTPFTSAQEARLHLAGYVEDLVEEQAEGITIELKPCQPTELTICSESELD